MKRLSRGNVRTPFRMEAFDIFSQGKFRSAIRAVKTLTVNRVRWSSALVSSDIHVPPSFAVEVVGMVRCRILVGKRVRVGVWLCCCVGCACGS